MSGTWLRIAVGSAASTSASSDGCPMTSSIEATAASVGPMCLPTNAGSAADAAESVEGWRGAAAYGPPGRHEG
ncbi:MAG: hypothetical protein IPJ15_05705 [Actinomycetales bacterium]|nr:hypothetical protein [Candidatus Phosphoribacter baldrii]